LALAPDDPKIRRSALALEVFGVEAAADAWVGTASVQYPSIEDKFSNQASGPSLVPGYTYPIDGGCPFPDRFDALIKLPDAEVSAVALYPFFGGQADIAAVSRIHEHDVFPDFDRSKALGYGFTLAAPRLAGIPPSAPNFQHVGVNERMRVLYKFLTSCRGERSAADTFRCWPCPTDPLMMTSNWAASSAFQSSMYGPLYQMQDNQAATGVPVIDAGVPRNWSHLDGNFPNPFNPTTNIRFSSSTSGNTTVRIFNVGGQLVQTISARAEVGRNEIRWDGRNHHGSPLGSGVYFYSIRFADGKESASRMMLLK
jgi:hypothetical protein